MQTPHQSRVESFMRLAGQEIPEKPTIPSEDVRILRAKLILEEAIETVKALGVVVTVIDGDKDCASITDDGATFSFDSYGLPDLIEIADGCADISVVTIGTLSACGIHDHELLQEVDKSNLAKFEMPKCPDCGHGMWLSESMGKPAGSWLCLENGGETHSSRPLADGPYRREDGKWIKPPYWKKPDIAGVLKRQAGEQALKNVPVAEEIIAKAMAQVNSLGLMAFTDGFDGRAELSCADVEFEVLEK